MCCGRELPLLVRPLQNGAHLPFLPLSQRYIQRFTRSRLPLYPLLT